MSAVVITTSWDDGHILDFRVADLLQRYKLTGTFYIPRHYLDEALSRRDIIELSGSFEIGAHSVTHRRLDRLDPRDVREEIEGSKAYLEDLLGRPVMMFCYPQGFFNPEIANAVREAKFIGARTVEKFTFEVRDPYTMGTTVFCYPYPLRKVSRNRYMLGRYLFQPAQQSWRDVWRLRLPLRAFVNWSHLARATFDYVCKHGGIWHLWGHSWQVEKFGMWGELEEILQYVSNHSGLLHLTNGDVVREAVGALESRRHGLVR